MLTSVATALAIAYTINSVAIKLTQVAVDVYDANALTN